MKFKTANSIQVVPQGKPFIDKKFNACYAAVNNFDTQKGLIAEAKVIKTF